MTIDTWLAFAMADAKRRGLPEVEALLQSFAEATRALRAAGFVDEASGLAGGGPAPQVPGRAR